jgi:hypothetical protein
VISQFGHKKRRGWCVFFAARSPKQPSFPVAMFLLKPEILKMLYAMWLSYVLVIQNDAFQRVS